MSKKLMAALLLASVWMSQVHAEVRGLSRSDAPATEEEVAQEGKRWALVIGINKYNDPKGMWRPLRTAINDANAVATLLKEKYHFDDVKLLINPSRGQIINSLDQLNQQVEENDDLVMFYAGHGYMDERTGRGYWIPSDAVGGNTATYIRNSTIKDEIGFIAKRAKHTLIIADSCFSGTLLSSNFRGVNIRKDLPGYYQKVAKRKSVQVLTAGGQEYVDDDYSNSGHSPFSYFLLNELELNDQPYMSFTELATNVKKSVANNVSQTPVSGTLHGLGDELGEFIFAAKLPEQPVVSDVAQAKLEAPILVDPVPRRVVTNNTGATSWKLGLSTSYQRNNVLLNEFQSLYSRLALSYSGTQWFAQINLHSTGATDTNISRGSMLNFGVNLGNDWQLYVGGGLQDNSYQMAEINQQAFPSGSPLRLSARSELFAGAGVNTLARLHSRVIAAVGFSYYYGVVDKLELISSDRSLFPYYSMNQQRVGAHLVGMNAELNYFINRRMSVSLVYQYQLNLFDVDTDARVDYRNGDRQQQQLRMNFGAEQNMGGIQLTYNW